jgi:hypothetical protein
MPWLTTLRYAPKLSVSWDGEELKYYVHNDRCSQLSMRLLTLLVLEYLLFWTWFWVRNIHRIPLMIWRVLHRKVSGELDRNPQTNLWRGRQASLASQV